jgi:hypothetical protein
MLDTPLVMCRTERGDVVAMLDRCPTGFRDAAAVRVRRMLQQMIEAETGSKPA